MGRKAMVEMMQNYEEAKKAYAAVGVDTEAAIRAVLDKPISIHCWQGDDVHGFEGAGELSGGIATTGNYPGCARNPQELMADFDVALSLIPGKHRINIHASYAITDENVDRDALKPEHFRAWIDYAKQRGLGIDFNPTLFSHPKAADSLTLSHPDKEIRDFWIRHVKACREIAAYIGKELGTPCLNNIWIPDGYKEIPADRLGPRMRLKAALDEIFSVKYDSDYLIDCVESKVFGIGVEAYTVGSNEFYLGYAAKNNIYYLLDNGHFHPTEMVSDKIPALLTMFDKIPLHVTRPMRWDSDHVVLLQDEVREIAKEIVRNDAMDKVLIGLDYFDASINRVSAWVVGVRNMQKALLEALLLPNVKLKELQDTAQFSEMMMLSEEMKLFPVGAVWQELCRRADAPAGMEWFDTVKQYEKDVLLKRG